MKKPAVHHHGLNYILTQAGISSETLRKKACRSLKIHVSPKTAPLITQLQIVTAEYNSFWWHAFDFEKIVSNHLSTHLHQAIKLPLMEIDAVVLPQDALQVHERHVEGVCTPTTIFAFL